MSITKHAQEYIHKRPALKICFQKGLLNYSKVAREIIKETTLKDENFDAIIVALRRLHRKISDHLVDTSRIAKLLRSSKIQVQNKISVIVFSKGHYLDLILPLQKEAKRKNDTFQIIEGISEATIIVSDEYLPRLKQALKYKIKTTTTDLVEVILRSPKSLEELQGLWVFSTPFSLRKTLT